MVDITSSKDRTMEVNNLTLMVLLCIFSTQSVAYSLNVGLNVLKTISEYQPVFFSFFPLHLKVEALQSVACLHIVTYSPESHCRSRFGG